MKVYYAQSGAILKIAERDLLVATASGVNVIYVYAPFPSSSLVTASFLRADNFKIAEIKMEKSIEEPCYWYLALTDETGILNVPGELEITVRFYYDDKISVMGIVTAHVYRSIGQMDDGEDYFRYYVSKELVNQSLRIDNIEKNPGSDVYVGTTPPDPNKNKVWLDINQGGEEIPLAARSLLAPTDSLPTMELNATDNSLPAIETVEELPPVTMGEPLPSYNAVDYTLPEMQQSLPDASEVDYKLPTM